MKEVPASLFSKRIKIVDGFRGLAILLVIGYHYTDFSPGWIGVDLFFVLSGFLITGKLLESAGHRNYFSSFYLKRLLRIGPLYFFVLFVSFILIPFILPATVSPSFAALLKTQCYYWTFSVNFYDAAHGWPANITFIPLWSLACEMQFYLIWPFIVLFLYRQRKEAQLLILAGFVAGAFLFREYGSRLGYSIPLYRYVLLPSRLDAFACGATIAICIKNNWFTALLKKGWIISMLSLLLALGAMLYFRQLWLLGSAPVNEWGYTLNALFWAGIFSGAWFGGRIAVKILGMKLLTTAGKYSYAMYIFHVPVKVILIKLMTGFFLPAYFIILISLIVTVGCSVISYHLLEKRFLYFKDSMVKQFLPG